MGKNYMAEVAALLGVEPGQSFKISMAVKLATHTEQLQSVKN